MFCISLCLSTLRCNRLISSLRNLFCCSYREQFFSASFNIIVNSNGKMFDSDSLVFISLAKLISCCNLLISFSCADHVFSFSNMDLIFTISLLKRYISLSFVDMVFDKLLNFFSYLSISSCNMVISLFTQFCNFCMVHSILFVFLKNTMSSYFISFKLIYKLFCSSSYLLVKFRLGILLNYFLFHSITIQRCSTLIYILLVDAKLQ
ncbi:hypothetical protein AGLY_002562 [Aphis glycines]|uniref:Uncharacterized protein n=1 Tax=Aphis glycines TaxID=307491 RepID=A0A6G0U0L0_APHGL|nr:hypothetical protein AGLY_002562 [Aphis glycines]